MYSVNRANKYLFFVFLFFIMGSLGISTYVMLTGKEISLIENILVSQYVLVLLPVILYLIFTKASIKETFLFNKVDLINILLSVALAIFLLPLLSLINLISQLFVVNHLTEAIGDIMDMPLWLLLLLMALTPAIIEELSMRGIILSNYRNKTVMTTCLMNGLFFGMFHMNINQFCYAFVLGIVFCLIVHLTNSIFTSIIMHFTVNGIMLIYQKVLLSLNEIMLGEEATKKLITEATTLDTRTLLIAIIVLLVICIITLPVALFILYTIAKRNNKTHIIKEKLTTKEVLNLSDTPVSTNDKIVTPIFIVNIILFISYVAIIDFIIPMLAK